MIYEFFELSYYKERGNISPYIDNNVLNNALIAVENAYIKKWMGNAYADAEKFTDDMQQNICEAIAMLAEGYLLVNCNNVTRFGAVVKENGDQSTHLNAYQASSAASVLRLQAYDKVKDVEKAAMKLGITFDWQNELNVLKIFGIW